MNRIGIALQVLQGAESILAAHRPITADEQAQIWMALGLAIGNLRRVDALDVAEHCAECGDADVALLDDAGSPHCARHAIRTEP